jgi:uncharacterized protein
VGANLPTFGTQLGGLPLLLWNAIDSIAEVKDDEVRRALTDANPWWRSAAGGGDPAAWTKTHRLLRDRAAYDLGYRAAILDDVATGPITDQLVVLAGPRRIGKSVSLLDTAATLCQRTDIDARQVIHLPCDGMRERDLRRALTLGREATRSVDHQATHPRVWLLDEVSGVPGWTSVLKGARDGTALGDDTVVATGSRWVEGESIVANLLAGRAGTANLRRRRHLLPMTFREFLGATRPELPTPKVVHPAHLQAPEVADTLSQFGFDVDAYDLAWQDYLRCGGFPRAVAEQTTQGAINRSYLSDLEAWLRADIDPDAPTESVSRLLAELMRRSTGPLNASNTAGTLGYANRPAFERRLQRLVASFAALTCPQRDGDGRAVRGSQYKVYLTDPVLAWLPHQLRAGLPAPDLTQLTELALCVSMARAVDGLEEGRWTEGDTIGYARTTSANEIDLAPVPVPTRAGREFTVPVESKWVDDRWRGEAKVMEGKFGAGILATKSTLDTEVNVWAVPAPLLALLLL